MECFTSLGLEPVEGVLGPVVGILRPVEGTLKDGSVFFCAFIWVDRVFLAIGVKQLGLNVVDFQLAAALCGEIWRLYTFIVVPVGRLIQLNFHIYVFIKYFHNNFF